ncbi:MAG: hypothetical protein RIQ53_1720 [Pseudomonadota bacterium]
MAWEDTALRASRQGRALAQPDLAVGTAPILMREDIDHAPRVRPGERMHQLFEARCDALCAAGRASHLAVDAGTLRWTYAELDAQANRLAHELIARGVRAGDRIALLFDKTPWSYAALLAVGKAQAAYVPLDGSFPADRIAFILRDAAVGWVLAAQAHEALLCAAVTHPPDDPEAAATPPARLLFVEPMAEAIAARPASRPAFAAQDATADALAYIIYTSGSTGRPKGVPIDQSQIVNFIRVAAEVYGYQDDDRVYQGLTLAFDFAVEEIWVPLVVGATLLPSGAGGSLLGADLADFLQRHAATALCCVPTLLATLPEALPQLRWVMVSGEACPRDLVARWHHPQRRLLNAYGPTEATVTATLGQPRPDRPVTIGRPLPTYAILVLEPAAQPGEPVRPLPTGEVGEIAIAGIGIARGYLNRDDQTRKAFVADTVGVPHNASGRLYRTGDLGRVNAEGEVEYLGRIDTQVKIRGYRIELAEIESLLLQVPAVRQGVVNPWQPTPGVTELVAYVTARPGCDAATLADLPVEVRAHLAARLPSYMVPAWVEVLPEMPMLASDKADRKALPPPVSARAAGVPGDRPVVAPADALEQALAEELAAVLGVAAVSVSATDHWFDELGVNSLLLAHLAARLRDRLQRPDLALRTLYGHPSVRALAEQLRLPATAAAAAAQAEVDAAVNPPDWRAPPAHRARDAAVFACGLAQAALAAAWIGLHAAVHWQGWHWVIDAPDWPRAFGRAAGFTAAWLLLALLAPVALKWALVGRQRSGSFPVWSGRYLRFWAVREAVRRSPAALLSGTPLMPVYLRMLGARVHGQAWIGLQELPATFDGLDIGADAVLSPHARLAGYRVDAGQVSIGPVHIGAGAVVGDTAWVDIHTRIGAQAVLAHASSLQAGQSIADGRQAHGSPTRSATDAEHAPLRVAERQAGLAAPGRLRRSVFSLVWSLGLVLPFMLGPLAAHALWGQDAGSAPAWVRMLGAWVDDGHGASRAGWLLAVAVLWCAVLVGGLLFVASVPRLLAAGLREGRLHPMYGWQYGLMRLVRGLSNVPLYNQWLGDSSVIVHYLRALGQRLPQLLQTGSNFGLAQQHDVPRLCTYGSGTMVSDGLIMVNADVGARGFQLHAVALGARSFLGNGVLVPPGHRLGDDCLLATKVMVPTAGALREGVGLLGSPAFVIPRSVARDRALVQADGLHDPQRRAAALVAKNRANAAVMGAWVLVHGGLFLLLALLWHEGYPLLARHGGWFAAGFAVLSVPLSLAWLLGVDALSRGLRPLQPLQVSLLDPRFWRHERHWKLGLANDHPLVQALAGTPMRAWIWRLSGMSVGRRLFDDGCGIPEKTLVRLGDDCTLGAHATLQGHSLEDGVFKSDRLWLGDGVTVGASAYVHYDTRLDDGARVAPDSFVMKGERLGPRARWQGNPAQAVSDPA